MRDTFTAIVTTPGDDLPDAEPTIVVSHSLWGTTAAIVYRREAMAAHDWPCAYIGDAVEQLVADKSRGLGIDYEVTARHGESHVFTGGMMAVYEYDAEVHRADRDHQSTPTRHTLNALTRLTSSDDL